jgi:hypothetical protein
MHGDSPSAFFIVAPACPLIETGIGRARAIISDSTKVSFRSPGASRSNSRNPFSLNGNIDSLSGTRGGGQCGSAPPLSIDQRTE